MSAAWDQAFESARREVGPLPLTREAFEARARARLTARLARRGRGAGELSLAALLGHSALGDLYLAIALEDGSQEAREHLAARTSTRLTAIARALGRDERQAQEAARTALEEATSLDPRSVLTAFDGSTSLASWLAVRMARGPAAAACPSEALFAGLTEGTLEGRERAALAPHLEACSVCRGALDVLQRAGLAAVEGAAATSTSGTASGARTLPPPLPRPRARPVPNARRPLLVVGLAVIGIVALSVLTAGRGLWDSEARRQDSEHGVLRAATELLRSEPGYFADFMTYDRDALARAEADPEHAAFAAVFPRGKVLLRTPSFRWSGGAVAGRFVVTLRDASGETVWTQTVTGDSLAWPAEAPPLLRELTFRWTVAAEGQPEGEAHASFRVEAEQELIRWERRKEKVAKAVPDRGTRDVLTAQMALRRGYVWEAFTLVQAHLERAPKDGYGRALFEHIQRVHGLRP